jgi:hypothetical protein
MLRSLPLSTFLFHLESCFHIQFVHLFVLDRLLDLLVFDVLIVVLVLSLIVDGFWPQLVVVITPNPTLFRSYPHVLVLHRLFNFIGGQ